MSESIVITIIKSTEGNAIVFKTIDFGKCYYTGSVTSDYYIHNGNNITISHYTKSSTCTGDKEENTVDINSEEFKKFCFNRDICTIEIKEIPDYVGYLTDGIDDDMCTHKNNMYLTYVIGTCGKCNENDEAYCMYKKCGVCENGTTYKCGNKTTNQENSSDDRSDGKSNDYSEGSNNKESSSNNNGQSEDTSNNNSEESKNKEDDSKSQSDEKSMNHSEDGSKGHSEDSSSAHSDGNSKTHSEDDSKDSIDSAPLPILSLIGIVVILII
ncbi:hypothetical protein EDI_184220 [Entamoeba dispar SAW760]|uniref:Uncharacterized protein n=1 Tax=Entamoeba dispar (strain ATCC PRA-260 / SAW760) TaxID=370354 RepID=B0EST0_ENTDS|nr:uncharacterized protein EDI_184220 [Entamoeba dispar SAW760]EDR22417.1 hypothetical protein EDI_184220 [Entamoeba dispar SAW760]|eukprot:EDR22417.1 hypothetical protein EDI_184220 [Entamoeba dispar SAW760]